MSNCILWICSRFRFQEWRGIVSATDPLVCFSMKRSKWTVWSQSASVDGRGGLYKRRLPPIKAREGPAACCCLLLSDPNLWMQKQHHSLIFIKTQLRCYNYQSCGHYHEATRIQMQGKFVFANRSILLIFQQLTHLPCGYVHKPDVRAMYHLLSFA